MTCSSETSQARPWEAASSATARIIGVGPADIEADVVRARRGDASAASSGAGDVALAPAAAVFGRQHDLDAQPLEQLDVVQLRRAARAVEQPRPRAASRAALPPASRTAPGRRRRRPSTPRAGGATGSNGRPSGPRQEMRAPGSDVVEQRRADADPLVEERDAGRRAVRVAQDFEDGKRPAQQRIGAARRS